jgi:O-antigen ligase
MKRGTLYADVVAAVFHSPLAGYGLGSFEGVFRTFQSEQLSVNKAWLSAHSAPLEVIFETGVIVFCVIPLAALTYARSALRKLKIDDCPTKFAGFGVFVSGSAHSLFDNTLSIPAVGLTFAVGLGLANSVKE